LDRSPTLIPLGFWVALDFGWRWILGGAGFWVAQRFTAAITGSALQIAEQLDFEFDFGWRSGSPLR
jgi:hypothetical protein